MKKLIIPLVGAALFIVAVGILLQKSSTLSPTQPEATAQSTPTVTINTNVIPVEIARTSLEREKGLSARSSLTAGTGMLFIFDSSDSVPTFWMRGMLIPLDIIWIQGGKVVSIDKNVPAPASGTSDDKLKTYSAGRTVDYVLEVNAGFSDSNSIKVGDSVNVSGI